MDGVGIKMKLRALSYVGDLKGVSFRYVIDYGDISYTINNGETLSTSGSATFMQDLERFIDETWNEVRFHNTHYIESATIESIPLILNYEKAGYDEDLPTWNMNSSYPEIEWDGDQLETLNFYWTTETGIPFIESYVIINETTELVPTNFSLIATDTTSGIDSCWLIVENDDTHENITFALDQNINDCYYGNVVIQLGNYSYWYVVINGAGNSKSTVRHDINITRSAVRIFNVEDEGYEFGTDGYLNFSISGTANGYWEFNIDGEQIENGTWTYPEDTISVNISDYSLGFFDYSIYANNTLGYNATYSGTFSVYLAPIFVSEPEDDTIFECSNNYTISWAATDDNPYMYYLYLNDNLIESGSWYDLIPISYEIDPCTLAQNSYHEYKLELIDYHGKTVTSFYGVNVLEYDPLISDEQGGDMYEDEIVEVSWTVIDHCAVNYTIEYNHILLGWQVYYQGNLTWRVFNQQVTVLIDGNDFPVNPGDDYTTYQLRCTVYDKNGNNDSDGLTFNVFPHPPVVSEVYDGFYFSDDVNAEITWNTVDNSLLQYTIKIKKNAVYETIQTGSLENMTEADITLNLYKQKLPVGSHEIVIYIEDTHHNIVNDTVIVENRGEEAAIEFNPGGLMMWIVTIGIALFGLYTFSKTDNWERYDQKKKTYIYGGTAAIVIGIIAILSIFGFFPVTFTKLPEVISQWEQGLGGYGLLITVIGVAVGSIAAVGGIYYLLNKRKAKQI